MHELNDLRVAVIGACGFIGSHLVEELSRRGARVWLVCRSPDRRAGPLQTGARDRVIHCDIRDFNRLLRIICRIRPRIVFHLAARGDLKESCEQARACVEANTLGALNVFEAARRAQSSRVVFADSVKVFGNLGFSAQPGFFGHPNSSYAVSKAAAWQLMRMLSRSGPPEVVSLRLTFVYGPRQTWNLIKPG